MSGGRGGEQDWTERLAWRANGALWRSGPLRCSHLGRRAPAHRLPWGGDAYGQRGAVKWEYLRG
jgi:hypothetical protein